jgi:hypothetical protein
MITIPELFFIIGLLTLVIFFFIYLPYRNENKLEVSDMVAIEDGENAEELCEQAHRSKWKQLTQEEMYRIETRHTSFSYYCPICERYRNGR